MIPGAYLVASLATAGDHPFARAISSEFLAHLGRISYSIYLLHVPLLLIALQVIRRVAVLQSATGVAVFIAAYLATVLAASHLSWRFIEQPGRRIGRMALAWAA
jgi:peptidoglycan/LPS O-acetylase OafA/YrhL